jgi:hypothetical protein
MELLNLYIYIYIYILEPRGRGRKLWFYPKIIIIKAHRNTWAPLHYEYIQVILNTYKYIQIYYINYSVSRNNVILSSKWMVTFSSLHIFIQILEPSNSPQIHLWQTNSRFLLYRGVVVNVAMGYY